MISQSFNILAAALALIGAANYAWATFRGKAQPNRISWLLWAVTPAISFAIELSQHVSFEITLITLSEAVGPLLVIIASLSNRKAYWKASVFDWICGAVSVASVVLWLVVGQADVALAFSLIASFTSAIPTIVKSYAHPRSESPGDYVLSFVAGLIALLTIRHWNLVNYGFPLYITVESLIIATLVLTPQRVRERKEAIVANALVLPQAVAGDTHTQAVLEPLPQSAPVPEAPPETAVASAGVINQHSEPLTLDFPVVGLLTWSRNPAQQGTGVTLRAAISHAPAPVIRAEYIGSVDPGYGLGFPMILESSVATVLFNPTIPKGRYPISVRICDTHGRWSALQSTILEIK